MDNEDFKKLLCDLCGVDLDELTAEVNQSIAEEISKRPKFKLNDNLYYIKNQYNYFKDTPKHYLNPNPEFLPKEYHEKIALYQIFNQLKTNTNLNQVILDCGYSNHKRQLKEILFKNNYIESYEYGNEIDFKLTNKGEKYFENIKWIECYLIFLDSFDFDEFRDYLKNSNDEFMNTSLKFIDTHCNKACKRSDFKALIDAHSSKALFYIINRDFENALTEELKLFLVRLNPLSSSSDLLFHEGVNQVNIHNLNNLIILCEIRNIEALFNNVWDSMNYNAQYFDKEKSLEILIKALKTQDFDEINSNLDETYFKDN